jgi:hypothetical protein
MRGRSAQGPLLTRMRHQVVSAERVDQHFKKLKGKLCRTKHLKGKAPPGRGQYFYQCDGFVIRLAGCRRRLSPLTP